MSFIYRKRDGHYIVTERPWPQPGDLKVAVTLWGARREGPQPEQVLVEETGKSESGRSWLSPPVRWGDESSTGDDT